MKISCIQISFLTMYLHTNSFIPVRVSVLINAFINVYSNWRWESVYGISFRASDQKTTQRASDQKTTQHKTGLLTNIHL